MKCESEGMENITALFARRSEVGADGAEGLGTSDGTETPGGLLLEFGHADIAFAQIVVEGHTRVGKKPQDIVRVLAQTRQEISRRGLLDTATLLAPARTDDPLQAVLQRNTSPTTSDGLAFSNGRPASATIPHSCSLSRSAHEFNNIIRQMSQKNKPLSALFCHRCIR